MKGQLIAIVVFLTMFMVGCQETPPPGWGSPVTQLLLGENAFPEGWQIDFESPEGQGIDSTINHVGREWWNPDKGSANISQSIWRAYTIKDAKRKYAELRNNPLLIARFTPSPDDYYVEFQPPSELAFQSQVADEFYVACGWVSWAYCEVVARYRNYVVNLQVPLEAKSQEHVRQGLTYAEIETALGTMDTTFYDFFDSAMTPTP